MKPSQQLLLSIQFLSILITSNIYAQNYKDTLDIKINTFHNSNSLPGFTAMIVNMDGILYENSQGYADLENKKPYTTKTIQCIASTTKTTIAYAIMKLQEEGKLSLESPINNFLPFKVVNPFFSDSIIRIRHLVTHTSGIQDTDNNYDHKSYYYTENTKSDLSEFDKDYLDWFILLKNNEKLSLEAYFKNIFSEKGDWYDKNTFHNKPFAAHYQYSNVGAGLMAYIIELVTGIPFDDYIDLHVFKKLNMKKTKFHEGEVKARLLAKSYVTAKMIPTPSLGFINYPDGGMHTNIKELSMYLIEMIKGYNGKSSLLTQASFKQMMSPILSEEVAASNAQRTFKNIGVFWQIDDDGSIKHYGGNPLGGSVYFSFNPSTNIGRILMTNYDARTTRESQVEFISIWRALEKYESKL